MKKLLLTSNGLSNSKIIKEFLALTDKPAGKIRLVLVPTASKNNKSYLNYELGCLTNLGIRKENIKIIKLDTKILYEDVRNFDVIYVMGGNTFYLLHKVRETGFGKIIKRFLDERKVYVGVSAGSYIVCPTIEAAGWKHADRNMVGLKDLTALKITPFLVTAHYDKKLKDILKKAINSAKYPTKILADGQAISVRNNKVELIGIGKEIKI